VVDAPQNRENRLAPWRQKLSTKKHNLPDIIQEDNRIKIVENRQKKQMITDLAEYNRIVKAEAEDNKFDQEV